MNTRIAGQVVAIREHRARCEAHRVRTCNTGRTEARRREAARQRRRAARLLTGRARDWIDGAGRTLRGHAKAEHTVRTNATHSKGTNIEIRWTGAGASADSQPERVSCSAHQARSQSRPVGLPKAAELD